jgi:hypothetical protein
MSTQLPSPLAPYEPNDLYRNCKKRFIFFFAFVIFFCFLSSICICPIPPLVLGWFFFFFFWTLGALVGTDTDVGKATGARPVGALVGTATDVGKATGESAGADVGVTHTLKILKRRMQFGSVGAATGVSTGEGACIEIGADAGVIAGTGTTEGACT